MPLEGQHLGHSHLLCLLGSKRLVLVGLAVLIVVALVSGIIWLKLPHYSGVTEFPIPTAAVNPEGIAAGPNGNLWFTELTGNKIGRITHSGSITEFVLPTSQSRPVGITAGPDGNLWFTEGAGKIGRITIRGSITEFAIPTPKSAPLVIVTGPDGNLWFKVYDGNQIGRIIPGK